MQEPIHHHVLCVSAKERQCFTVGIRLASPFFSALYCMTLPAMVVVCTPRQASDMSICKLRGLTK